MNRKLRRLKQSKIKKGRAVTYGGVTYAVEDAYLQALELEKLKRPEEAGALYKAILDAAPDHFNSLRQLAVLVFYREDADQAVALLRRAMALRPLDPEVYNTLGYVLTSKGEMQEAEAAFQHALMLKPDHGMAIHNLVRIRKYTSADHKDAERIERLLARDNLTPAQREILCFSLGKIYDESGAYDAAFPLFAEGNRLRNETINYAPERSKDKKTRAIALFTREFFEAREGWGDPSRLPVFIVGMPRSGTTLLANVLSNHPAIETAGELTTLPEMAVALHERVPSGRKYPEAAAELTAHDVREMAATYLEKLQPFAGPAVMHVLDKHPINFIYLGLLHLMFPRAAIIHCRRDAMDTCLSNFFQYFSKEYAYSFNLENIGHYYLEYLRLMRHWHAVFPGRILDVDYEALVGDTQTEAGRVLDFLGLPWDDACVSPHTNKRVVKTASMWQVRQPIYSDAMKRWKHYEKHLEPLKAILGDEVK